MPGRQDGLKARHPCALTKHLFQRRVALQDVHDPVRHARPRSGAPTTELYAAAIDMCAWAETRGAIVAVLSEHHGAEDGHLPSPLMLASAIAARTERLAIMLAAVVLPFWDPVRLAEEMSVLDIISNGRVSYAFGIGHRPRSTSTSAST